MFTPESLTKILRLAWVTVLLAATLTACSGTPSAAIGQDVVAAPIAQSNLGRDTSPNAPDISLAELVAGNRAFAIDLYQAIRPEDGNLFYSPYSISTALAMVYAGARGSTEQQMAQVLHYSLPQAQLHTAFNALDLSLAQQKKDDFTLSVANSAWAQEGFFFLPEYLDLLARNYGAGVRLVDYIDPGMRELARQAINDLVSQQTEGKIQDLLPEGILNENSRLVLANAVYFNAEWEIPFSPDTRQGPFQLLDGTSLNVPMMSRRAPAGYLEGDGYEVVALDYKGGRIQMVVLLPAAGRFSEIEQGLDAEFVRYVLEGLSSPRDLKLYLPKFAYEMSLSLKDTLSEMGMPDAFEPGARSDFSGMTGKDELFIREVVHKAFVAVDELGTEAAAATGAVAEWESLPKTVRADRPFIFFIYDLATGSLLFVGRLLNPLG